MNSYYNTNNESGATLKDSIKKASSQEERIARFYSPIKTLFTAEEAHQSLFKGDVPLTSVRRAITNLTKQGSFVKTTTMKVGKYGKLIHTYKAL